ALLSLASVFAGCSDGKTGNPDNPADTSAHTEASQADETSAVTEPAEYTNPGLDFNGRDFTALDYNTDDYFWHAATYSDIFAPEENGDPINDAQFKRNTKVEEELNVKLKIHGVSGVNRNVNGPEFQKLVLAGEDVIDIGFMFLGEAKKVMAEPSMSVDLYTVPTLDLSASWWHDNFIEEYTIYDRLHLVTGDISLYNTFSPLLYFYSKTLAEDYSLGNLYEIARDGKWTNDVMIEMSKKVASDLDGNGVMDENDRYGIALQDAIILSYAASSNVRFVDKDENGDIVPVLNNEKTISFLEKMIPFISDYDVCNNTRAFQKKFTNVFYELHIPAFKDDRILFNFNQLLITFELRAMDTDFGILPTPKYDEAQEEYLSDISSSWCSVVMIPATNTDLSFTGYVLDSLGYYSQQYVTPAFIEMTVLDKAIRDDESAEMLEIVLDSGVYDMGKVFDWGKISSSLTNLVTAKSTDFASKWASIEKNVISEIDATLAQLQG
nr:hypothetical protein [Clostridia bacterium]